MSEGADHTYSHRLRQLALAMLVLLASPCVFAAVPRVVLFIVVDQFLPQYLDASYSYTGGLKRLREESAWFTNTHYQQVPTETAPGHATLISGFPPAVTGVVGNDWYDKLTQKDVSSTRPGVMLAATLGDRLKDKDPRSKVIAITGKERSTMMLAGHNPDFADYFFLRADQTIAVNAQKKIIEHSLGQDDATDLVALSFPATDRIGHDKGPDSPEMRENLIELDKTIGDFLSFCDRTFGRENYIAILSSDHGVLPMPESDAGRRMRARRIKKDELQNAIEAALKTAFPKQDGVLERMNLPDLYLDTSKITSLEAARAAIKSVPEVAEAYAPPFAMKDPYVDMYKRSYFPGRSGDIVIRLHEKTLTLTPRQGTNHGSPYGYDTHVPLLLWGAPFKPGQYARDTAVTDLIPTILSLLQLPLDPRFEGKPLIEAIRK